MGNVYIEARPKSRPHGSHIEDYVVEDHADHALGTFKTQQEAIEWAKRNGHSPLVARVRHLNDKKMPDHWRAAQLRIDRNLPTRCGIPFCRTPAFALKSKISTAAKFMPRVNQLITSIKIEEDLPMRLIIRSAIFAMAVALAAPVSTAIPTLTASAQAQTDLVDINTATAAQLDAIKDIGPSRAAAIIKGRPYKRKDELVTKKILSQSVYDKIKDKIIAKQ